MTKLEEQQAAVRDAIVKAIGIETIKRGPFFGIGDWTRKTPAAGTD
jgi:hypothetical protein